jgi:hypothetical protein
MGVTTMPDISIFDRRGVLILTEENLPDDPALRERFPVLKQAYDASMAADAALEAAKDTLATCVQQVSAAEQYIAVHFPMRGDAGRISDLKRMIADTRRERFGV